MKIIGTGCKNLIFLNLIIYADFYLAYIFSVIPPAHLHFNAGLI